jgi:hypothetical protein
VAKFIYLRRTLTYQICVHAEIKSRVDSGNDCYHSAQNLLPYSLLSIIKFKNNNLGKACSTYVGEKLTGISWGNLRERHHLENLSVDGWIILKLIFKKTGWGLD